MGVKLTMWLMMLCASWRFARTCDVARFATLVAGLVLVRAVRLRVRFCAAPWTCVLLLVLAAAARAPGTTARPATTVSLGDGADVHRHRLSLRNGDRPADGYDFRPEIDPPRQLVHPHQEVGLERRFGET
eukprot:4427031-Pyramimonas_sp.AAC.2